MTTVRAPSRTVPVLPIAVAAGSAGFALTPIGTYLWTPWKNPGPGTWGLDTGGRSIRELLLLIGFAAIGTIVVFGVVARTLHRAAAAAAKHSLGLSALVCIFATFIAFTG